jgi:L-ribulokinase
VLQKRFAKEPAAIAWLWKDHTGVAEANQITELARQIRPQYLAKCGGTYSSEWFFSKILRCLRVSPKVFEAAHLWVEIADWIPAMLTGTQAPGQLVVGVCAAGHKAMYNEQAGTLMLNSWPSSIRNLGSCVHDCGRRHNHRPGRPAH